MNSKACTKCGEVKPLSAFHKQKDGKSGRRAHCKECTNEAKRELRKRPEQKAKQLEYQQRPEVKAKKQEYRNRPEVKARAKERAKQYREGNADSLRDYQQKYHKTAKRRRKNRLIKQEYRKTKDGRIKEASRVAVRNAVDRGDLPPVSECPCCDCGCQAQEYHHIDYTSKKGLNVVPLCQRCHIKRHKAKRK